MEEFKLQHFCESFVIIWLCRVHENWEDIPLYTNMEIFRVLDPIEDQRELVIQHERLSRLASDRIS